LRLFVVEDLSREVIEQLGYHFNIEPDFFRAHIYENIWYNVRDPFYNPPTLAMDMRERNWFQLRFVQVRYYESGADFYSGQRSTDMFNVGRKLYDDENKSFWDKESRRAKDLVHRHDGGWRDWMWGAKSVRGQAQPIQRALPLFAPGNKEKPKTVVDAKVGYVRSKATFWMKPAEADKPAIGTLPNPFSGVAARSPMY
jgi:hypothetical protein